MNALILILVAGSFYFSFYWLIIRKEPMAKTRNYYLICSLCELGIIAGCVYVLGKSEELKLNSLIIYLFYAITLYEFYLSIRYLIQFLRFKENNIKKESPKQH